MNIGLVLGGGGARGLAHVGALKALEEYNMTPTAISGCSMGAIVGALYASGKRVDELQDLVANLPYLKMLQLGELGGLVGRRAVEAYEAYEGSLVN
jgi:NTE family protein